MEDRASSPPAPTLTAADGWNWDRYARGEQQPLLAAALAAALPTRRWFGAKTRAIRSLEVVDAIPLSDDVQLLLANIEYTRGPAEIYQLPLAFAADDGAPRSDALVRVVSPSGQPLGVLHDALGNAELCPQFLELFDTAGTRRGQAGQLDVAHTAAFDRLRGAAPLEARPVRSEQSNSSVIFGQRLILKAFRRIETGVNPDFEISEFLTRQAFANTPPVAGSLEYRGAGHEPWVLATLQAFAPNRGDAWQFTLDWLDRTLPALAADASLAVPPPPAATLARAAEQPITAEARSAYGEFLRSAELLGTRTGQMHVALASDPADADFAPEPFTALDRRAYFERCAAEARETFELLAEHAPRLDGDAARLADGLSGLEQEALDRDARLVDEPVEVAKIRCHGDYHLGQVLATNDDFMIIDFEGEPARSIAERRQKTLALRDVAGMIRSFHYASRAAATTARAAQPSAQKAIAAHARSWYAWTSTAFLAAYRQVTAEAVFLPDAIEPFERLLGGCLLEKALYELRYELNNRPDWVSLPLAALADLLGGAKR